MALLAVENRAGVRPPESPRELDWIRSEINERYGLSCPDSRRNVLQRALDHRMRELDVPGLTEYEKRLRGVHCEPEWRAFIEEFLNRETSFFRHPASFQALTEHLLSTGLPDRILRLWSAGCSTGEEAYSLAMVMLDAGASPRFRVLGTDLSQKALEKAHAGVYSAERVKALDPLVRVRHFEPRLEKHRTLFAVREGVKAHVSFEFLNLWSSQEEWPSHQDVVFCQNVLIYFDEAGQIELMKRLASCVRAGGLLCFGPGEAVRHRLDGFRPLRFDQALFFEKVN